MCFPQKVVGAVNVQRRTWDKADYEEKAKARAANEAEGVVANDGKWKTEFPDAPVEMERVPGSKRAYLTSEKQESVHLGKNLHQRVVCTSFVSPVWMHAACTCLSSAGDAGC